MDELKLCRSYATQASDRPDFNEIHQRLETIGEEEAENEHETAASPKESHSAALSNEELRELYLLRGQVIFKLKSEIKALRNTPSHTSFFKLTSGHDADEHDAPLSALSPNNGTGLLGTRSSPFPPRVTRG